MNRVSYRKAKDQVSLKKERCELEEYIIALRQNVAIREQRATIMLPCAIFPILMPSSEVQVLTSFFRWQFYTIFPTM